MIQYFKNFPLKYKLISCFFLIISINAVSGMLGLRILKELGELVNMTYDKALMAGTFAQASKIDFLQGDYEFRSAILSETESELDSRLERVSQTDKDFLEDLAVVSERSLSTKSRSLVDEIKTKFDALKKFRDEIAAKIRSNLKTKTPSTSAMELVKEWETNRDKKALSRKITAMYDDAAVVGYQFRLDSESKSIKNFKLSLGFLVTSILISLGLSVAVSYLIIKPLLSLENVCKQVGFGDYKVRAPIVSSDEFGTLGTSFNSMLTTIEDKSENISSLLSSLPFGLFYFDKKGIISKERSQATDVIFSKFSEYENLGVFFGNHNCNTRQINEILEAVFQGLMPFTSSVHLFPRSITVKKGDDNRTVQLTFKPKYGPKKKLERVIVLAEDVTEKIRAQEESKVLTERVERVSRVSAEIVSYKEFSASAFNLYESILLKAKNYSPSHILDIKRDLHSLKGLLGIYAFTTCASEIHSIESFLENEVIDNGVELLARISKAFILFEEQSTDLTNLLALNTDSGLKYYDEKKVDHLRNLIQLSGDTQLISTIQNLNKFPVSKVLAKYSKHAQNIAAKLENKKVRIVFGESDDVSYEEVQRLDSVLMHVLNNSLDHGIEATQERLDLNKTPYGTIQISCKRESDNSLKFSISDDGKGINGDFLLKKAIKTGLFSEEEAQRVTEDDKINLIFASGLSSKESSSEISGRGIGMDAVKSYLESIGGKIELMTKLGTGTTFSFTVPPMEIT